MSIITAPCPPIWIFAVLVITLTALLSIPIHRDARSRQATLRIAFYSLICGYVIMSILLYINSYLAPVYLNTLLQ